MLEARWREADWQSGEFAAMLRQADGWTLDTLPPFALELALSHPSLILSDLVCVRSLCRSLRAAASVLAPLEQPMWDAVYKVGDLPSLTERTFDEQPQLVRVPQWHQFERGRRAGGAVCVVPPPTCACVVARRAAARTRAAPESSAHAQPGIHTRGDAKNPR